MVLSLHFGAVSDIGRNRRKNDDSGYAGPHFVAVADGMGGAPAGDVASSVAIQTLRRLDTTRDDDMLEQLAGAIHRAHDRLAEVLDHDADTAGMGTTLTAALFSGSQIGVAHLGDSRGYLWREGELLRISHDHSWVQSLIDEGRITEEEAATHAYRSMLLKVLDGRHDPEPDLTVYDVQAGDRLLLCSDGLSGFVAHRQIEQEMSSGTPQELAARLTQLALDSGSTDNVTVIIADFVETDEDAAAATGEGPEPILVGAASSQRPSPLALLRTFAHRDASQSAEILLDDPDIDPEELRYALREPRRYVWLKRSLAAAVIIAVLCVGGWFGYRWTQQQYYVGAVDDHVAIYQGVQSDLPGLSMHHVYERQDISLAKLPDYRRNQVVGGLSADGLDDARRIVAELQTLAQVCAQQPPPQPTTTQPPVTLTPTSPPGTKQPTIPGQRTSPGSSTTKSKPAPGASADSPAAEATPNSPSAPLLPSPTSREDSSQSGSHTPLAAARANCAGVNDRSPR